MIIICGLKIDPTMAEPRHVKLDLSFYEPHLKVKLFDFLAQI